MDFARCDSRGACQINNTSMRSGQGPDEYLYIMDSRCDRLNPCNRPGGPTDRQGVDNIR